MDFPRYGNQLADSSLNLGAPGDDRAAADLDESALNVSGPRPRRHDDDDEGSELAEDDDLESTNSAPIAGNAKGQGKVEEEKELPPHACA